MFIAEVSSNHHGNVDRCLKFVDTARQVGCDAVKFQLFNIDTLFAPEVLEVSAAHRARKEWELPISYLERIVRRCKENDIQFCCTPFDLESVEILKDMVDIYKIASYELLWSPLIRACAMTGKPMIISTGMATEEEVIEAVKVAKSSGCENLKLLHCVSGYPTPHNQCNLSAIETMRNQTGLEIGWSDHTVDPAVIYRAVNRWGAKTIEFHLDLEGSGEEYSSGHCWLPKQIEEVIRNVRRGYETDGTGEKTPVEAENADREWRADPDDGLRPIKKIRNNLSYLKKE